MDKKAIKSIYETPLLSLLAKSHEVHKKHHTLGEIQVCSLVSFKTGGCEENCKYCPQSSAYQTDIKAQPFLSYEEIIEKGKEAILLGASRICIGAAWRSPKPGKAFDILLKAIKEISTWNIEVCCTLGMLSSDQARQLKEAGLYAYNHNLDSSEEFYKTIITTRTYQERLATLNEIDKVDLSLCCGGILGMGETDEDRISLIQTLASRKKAPESIPLNFFMPSKGSPLEKVLPINFEPMLRMIATLRIIFPKTMIRVAAGRKDRSFEEHLLYFFAGCNSLFFGEKLLTLKNSSYDRDEKMFHLFGLTKRKSLVS